MSICTIWFAEAKYSYFLLWILVLLLVLETPAILRLWLKNVPEYSVVFVRLSLATALCNTLGHNFSCSQCNRNVGRYQTWVTIVGGLVFPLSLVVFKLGCEPQTAFYIYFLVYFVLIFCPSGYRVRKYIGMPKSLFVKEVFIRIIPVTLLSAAVPSILVCGMSPLSGESWIVSLVSVCSVAVTVYFTGLTDGRKGFCHQENQEYQQDKSIVI